MALIERERKRRKRIAPYSFTCQKEEEEDILFNSKDEEKGDGEQYSFFSLFLLLFAFDPSDCFHGLIKQKRGKSREKIE